MCLSRPLVLEPHRGSRRFAYSCCPMPARYRAASSRRRARDPVIWVYAGFRGEGAFTVTWIEDGVGLSSEWFWRKVRPQLRGCDRLSASPSVRRWLVDEPGPVVVHLDRLAVRQSRRSPEEVEWRLGAFRSLGCGFDSRVDSSTTRWFVTSSAWCRHRYRTAWAVGIRSRPGRSWRFDGRAGDAMGTGAALSRYLGQVKLDARAHR